VFCTAAAYFCRLLVFIAKRSELSECILPHISDATAAHIVLGAVMFCCRCHGLWVHFSRSGWSESALAHGLEHEHGACRQPRNRLGLLLLLLCCLSCSSLLQWFDRWRSYRRRSGCPTH